MKKSQKKLYRSISFLTGSLLVVQSFLPGFIAIQQLAADEEQTAATEQSAPTQGSTIDERSTATPSPTNGQETVNIDQATEVKEQGTENNKQETESNTQEEVTTPTPDTTPTPIPEANPTTEPTKNEEPPKETSPPVENGQILDGTSIEITPTPTQQATTIGQETVNNNQTRTIPEINEKSCIASEDIRNSSEIEWSVNDFENTAETRNPVELGVKYQFPKNSQVSVTFTCLPTSTERRTRLKIQEINVSDLKLPDEVNASDKAYDITTGMEDGTFEYTITLPKSEGQTTDVSFIEKSISEIQNLPLTSKDIQSVEKNNLSQEENTVRVEKLDHFTIFYTVQSFDDATYITVDNDFYPGQTVYAKATRSQAANMRLRFRNPSNSVVKTCDAANATTVYCNYQLPNNAPTGVWDIQIGRCDQNCGNSCNWEWSGYDEDHFTVHALKSIEGYKWNDQNGDGVRNKTHCHWWEWYCHEEYIEPTLSNWTIFIDTNEDKILNGSEISTTTTNNGNYHFDVAAGTYQVCEVQKAGWTVTYPSNNTCQTVTVNSCDITNKNFGNKEQPQGTITIDKVTNPAGDTTDFTFTLTSTDTQVNQNITIKDQETPFSDTYETGVYVIEEHSLPSGWNLSNLVCNQPATIDTNAHKATFDLDANEHITCTFTNTYTSPCPNLFFSEYIEGNSFNKALEIYNPTNYSISLQGYTVVRYANGNSVPNETIALLNVMVAPGDVYVLAHSSANTAITSQADQLVPNLDFNGDDAVVLKKGSIIVDVIGQIGFDPGTEWGSGLTSTADNTLVRKCGLTCGDKIESDAYNPSTEWDGYATNTFSYLGSHTVLCFINGSVQGCKYEDVNGDHIRQRDGTENQIRDWTIRLYNSDWIKIDEKNTGYTGVDDNRYYFNELSMGVYYICEVGRTGWVQTAPVQEQQDVVENRSSNIFDEGQYCYQINITSSGQSLTSKEFGNQYKAPKLEISKSNDALTDKNPGESVVYTITVKALDNPSYNVEMVDLLPAGFTYRAGSFTSSKAGVSEPTYASPGTWNLGTLNPGDEITLTLIADIDTAQNPGTYKDLALAYGCADMEGCQEAPDVLAQAVIPGKVDETFVGTDVTVIRDQQDAKNITVEKTETREETKEERETREALESKLLPQTGASSIWIMIISVLILGGLTLIVHGSTQKKSRRHHA